MNLDEWAELFRSPLPKVWDDAAVKTLCESACEFYDAGAMLFAELGEDEEKSIEDISTLRTEAKWARSVLLPTLESLKRKAPFFATEVQGLLKKADAHIARAQAAEKEGIIFSPPLIKKTLTRNAGRPVTLTSKAIKNLQIDLNKILQSAGVTVQNERARRIAELISVYFPKYHTTVGSIIQHIS